MGTGRTLLGRGDDMIGSPHRARISQFELILLLKLDKQFPVEQFEAAMSQSIVPSPHLSSREAGRKHLDDLLTSQPEQVLSFCLMKYHREASSGRSAASAAAAAVLAREKGNTTKQINIDKQIIQNA